MCVVITAEMTVGANGAGAPPRTRSSFDTGWRFALVNRTDITDPTGAYANAAGPSYDDSAWRVGRRPARLEHRAPPDEPAPAPARPAGTGFYQGGLGWYRKTFTLPAARRQARSPSSSTASTWTRRLLQRRSRSASHPYGYTGFEVDLTDAREDRRRAERARRRRSATSCRAAAGTRAAASTGTCTWSSQDPVHVARHGVFVTTPSLEATYAQGPSQTVHVADDHREPGQAGRRSSAETRPSRTRGRVTVVVRRRETGRQDLRIRQPAPVVDRPIPYLYTLTTETARRRRRVDSAPPGSARAGSASTRTGPLPQRPADEGQGRRPAPRHGRDRLGDQQGRAAAADADHEVDGRQRVPDVPQPAVAGDARGLRGARHRDDGRGVRRLAPDKVPYDYGALLRRQQRRRHQGDGRCGPQQPGRDHVVDRQRDPARRRTPAITMHG